MKAKDLTAVEKAKLVMGANFWTNETLDGRVYEFVVSDGPVGLRQPTDRTAAFQVSYPSIAYPATVVLSQTWNKELAALQGKALGNDCIEQNVDTLLGPGVNIKRDPLNGRNFEYYSEDPYLAGTMAREYISGVQSMHVGTCIKHFCCNNMEFSRHWASMEVDERTLREIYLKPFEIACEAKPWSLMCSYNLVNGRRMSENKKLYDVLHHEFGFDGLIISDWEAVKDPVASLNAGLGLEMPYNEVHHKEMMEKAEKLGKKLLLPIDTTIAAGFPDPIDGPIDVQVVDADNIPADMEGLDIGTKTQELFAEAVKSAKTVVWNGPMGVFENPTLAKGTIAVAKALADTDATTIIGGGDSAAAVIQLGFADKMSHISTGGGASLEYLEGKTLPGIAVIADK